jgi:hypothetical protein
LTVLDDLLALESQGKERVKEDIRQGNISILEMLAYPKEYSRVQLYIESGTQGGVGTFKNYL